MKPVLGNMQTSIRLTVVTVVTVATFLTAALAIGLQYYFGHAMAREAATDLYATAASGIAKELKSVARTNATVIDLLDNNPILLDPERAPEHLEIFTSILEKNPLYYGIYLGTSDNTFYEVINLDTSEHARKNLRALPTDRWLIVTVRPGEDGARRHFSYLDKDLSTRFSRSEPTDFNVSTRPWFTSAMASDAIQFSDSYLFAQLGVPGRTVSKRIGNSGTVVAIDTTMATISSFLNQHKAAEQGDIFLYHDDGQVVASSLHHKTRTSQPPVPTLVLSEAEKSTLAALPELRVSNSLDWPPIDYAHSGQPAGYSIDIIELIARMTGLELRFVNGYSWPELVQQYKQGDIDLLLSVLASDDSRSMGALGREYLELSPALVMREDSEPITDLDQLNFKSLAIPAGSTLISDLRTRYPDIAIIPVESTLQAMQRVMNGDALAALGSEIVMRHVAASSFLSGLQYQTNTALGNTLPVATLHIMTPEAQPQLRLIIDKAIAAIGEQQRHYLKNRWLNLSTHTDVVASGSLPSESLLEIAAQQTLQGKLNETRHLGQPYLAYATQVGPSENPLFLGVLSSRASVVAPFLEKVKLSLLFTAGFLLLAVPLSWFLANPIVRPIRQLALQNDKVRRREYASVERVNSHVFELDELSASMVKMVAAIQTHELEQRALMDAFIELIAQAIDDKSAYTGGHCKRVPELAFMLAEQASTSALPEFQHFHLDTEDEWREFRIAAWLHDCGKITTPEHIVDKGSKLETIYNRVHEVRMRFEVLLRDAEIDYLKNVIEAPDKQAEFADLLAKQCSTLQDDFAFVASCNVGGEFLDQEKLDRLVSIAKTTWQRHFDDRIGLSPLEELRAPAHKPTLPVTEQLLSDKPEHIIKREQTTNYPPEFGIDMDIPEHLYNLGEIYNLCVSRGTLTSEDRFKINEHMISTIKMLESLPFPEELKNVPRYASTHHETMKGTGYPRKIPGEDLSVLERILAIADIFEALTASDRPYKKAKSIEDALEIMQKMVDDNHIDKDCFDLFTESGVYLQYARKFLPASRVAETGESTSGAGK